MSVREEIAQAIHGFVTDEPCLRCGSLADAALAIVRAHRDRLADELEAEAEQRDKEAAILNDTWTSLRATKFGIAAASRSAARRLRALYEEQTK